MNKEEILGIIKGDIWIDCSEKYQEAMNEIEKALDEHKQGKWVKQYDNPVSIIYRCSECNRPLAICTDDTLDNYPYCHCGADMRGSNENEKDKS